MKKAEKIPQPQIRYTEHSIPNPSKHYYEETQACEEVCGPREMSNRFKELIRNQQEIELRIIHAIGYITGNTPSYTECVEPDSHYMSLNMLEQLTNSNIILSSNLQELLK